MMAHQPAARIGAGCRDMSLREALADPLIRLVMAADRVSPARLAVELGETARRLARNS
jgi:hypothetical protein